MSEWGEREERLRTFSVASVLETNSPQLKIPKKKKEIEAVAKKEH